MKQGNEPYRRQKANPRKKALLGLKLHIYIQKEVGRFRDVESGPGLSEHNYMKREKNYENAIIRGQGENYP
jgi:hypothetical protein